MWAHVLDYTGTLTTCITAERQPGPGRRGTESARATEDALVWLLNPTKQRPLDYCPLRTAEKGTVHLPAIKLCCRVTQSAQGEKQNKYDKLVPHFAESVCTSPPPPPLPLALSRCCKTGADNFRFLHSEWHVNKPAHQSQQSSVTRQRSLTLSASDSESYQLMEHSLYESFSSLANASFCTWDMSQLHDGQDFTITHGYHLLSVKMTVLQDVQAVVSVPKN